MNNNFDTPAARAVELEKQRRWEQSRAASYVPALKCHVGDPLTMLELRRALKSSTIKHVFVPVTLIYGQEAVPVEITKKALLAAMMGDEDSDWTTEFILTSHSSISAQ